VSGYGVTVGFHRLFSHRSFVANRPLKIALAVAGSMAVEGSPISWVAAHRRHHRFSDRPGDPHSPHLHGTRATGRLRGLFHAHVGWLFTADPTSAERFAADLQADEDLRRISRFFPVIAVLSFTLPFGIGWLWSGTLGGALRALLWGGIIRMFLLHHTTWSVNSLCHVIGRRPFRTRDRSSNVASLALVSMGESWHNLHHADPTSARHGVGRGEIDISAGTIRLFEKLGWAWNVRWPTEKRLAKLAARPDEPAAA
jgi:stearoyl-CoA desaturase (delta-9 desaturase)